MATTTSYFSWSTESTAGITGYIVNYQLYTASIWTQINTSGTTIAIPSLAINRIYAFQVETLATTGNILGPISQAINITNPGPIFSPTSTSIGLSFNNLSVDMDQYATTIALTSDPTTILQSHILSPSGVVTDTFNGLNALTNYVITITPAANQFFKQFVYNVTTLLNTQCPAPLSVTTTLS